MAKLKFKEQKADDTLRLDLGAGKGLSTPEGFTPVDKNPGKGIKVVDLVEQTKIKNSADLIKPHVVFKPWPWKSGSVGEARAAYLLHYLTPKERVHFFNELYRILKSGASCQIIVPHWAANRAYADINVQWPPVAEGFFHTLSKAWRDGQNSQDESGFTCNFDVTMGYGMHPNIVSRNVEYQQNAVQYWKEAAQDLIVTLTKP